MSATASAEPSRRSRLRRGWRRWLVALGAPALAILPGPLVPSAALAKAHTLRAEGCELNLQAGAPRVIAGETTTLQGSLTCPESTPAEQAITIYGHTAGTPGASPLDAVTTEAGGVFHFTSEALTANSSFYAVAAGLRSERVRVRVAPQVTIAGPPSGTELVTGKSSPVADATASATMPGTTVQGARVTFTGTVSPEEAGPRVALERERGAGWIVLAYGHVESGGAYSITHTFGIAGAANVRVVMPAHQGRLLGVSAVLSYEVVHGKVATVTSTTTARRCAPADPRSGCAHS